MQHYRLFKPRYFSEEGSMEVVPVCSAHRASMIVHELLECYNVAKEEHDEEDPRNVQVPETEGEHIVEGQSLNLLHIHTPIKTHKGKHWDKQRIPKFAQIGDYWSDETVEKIADLLHEYQDLFPTTFSEMKGIVGT
jgi:hypothetical protein